MEFGVSLLFVLRRGDRKAGKKDMVHSPDAQKQLQAGDRQGRLGRYEQQGRTGEMKKPTKKEWMKAAKGKMPSIPSAKALTKMVKRLKQNQNRYIYKADLVGLNNKGVYK